MTLPDDANRKVSSMEKCGLVCHLFLLPLGFLYILWVVVPEEQLEETWHIHYYPPKEWSIHAPLSIVLLFFAAPLLYAGLNSLTVPKLTSMDTIRDEYTRAPPLPRQEKEEASGAAPTEKSTLPTICDLDPATLVWKKSNIHSSRAKKKSQT